MAFVFSRIFSIILRVLQIVCAAIVTGLVGDYIDDVGGQIGGNWGGRFIYTIVISSISMLIALIFLIPFTATLTIFPVDLLLFVLWIVSFAILADALAPLNCNYGWGDQCEEWKTTLAFSFINAILWLLSAFLAMWVIYRGRTIHSDHRRRWYRSGYY